MKTTCPACRGRGLIHWHPHWDNGHEPCPTCKGSGKIEDKMKNKLADLNDHLFAQLERLSNEDLSPEQIATEVKRAEAIVSVSDQIVGNADLQLQAAKLFAQHGGSVLSMLPQIGGPK